jgi:hypothetical protein
VSLLGSGQFDYDEGVYWQSLRALASGHRIFSSVFSSQPPAFLLLLQPPWSALGGTIGAARLVMLGWGILAVASGAVIGWRLLGRGGALFLAGLLAADPLMIRQSVVLQAEGPAIALSLLGLALTSVAVTDGRPQVFKVAAAAAGAALVLGILTKLSGVAALPAVATLVFLHPQALRRSSWIAAGAVAAGAALLIPLQQAWQPMWDQAVTLHIASRSLDLGQLTDSGVTGAALRESPLLALAAAGAVIGLRRYRVPVLVGMSWMAGAVAAILLTHPLWPRHLVALVPGAAMLGATALITMADRLRGRLRGESMLAAATAVYLVAMTALGLATLQPGPAPASTVAALQRDTAPGAPVLTDEQFIAAAAGRAVPPEFVDTSFVRVEAGRLTTNDLASVAEREHICAVLLGSGRLEQVPGFQLWLASNFDQAIELPGGSRLYVRTAC